MQNLPSFVIKETEAEIAVLVRQLHEAQERLRELAGGEVDAFLLPDGHSYLLHDAQEKLRESEAAQRSFAASQSFILNALPAHVALIDHESVIVSVNEGWRNFAQTNGLQSSSFGVGENYLEVCDQAQDAEEAHGAAAGIRAVLNGMASEFSLAYSCHSPEGQRWFQLRVNPLNNSGPRGAVVMHVDISAMHLAEQAAQRSQKHLRNLIDGLGPSMFVALLTPQGILVEINQPPLTAAGLKAEDVLGKPFAETPWWHSPDARQQLREAIVRAANGEPSRYDVRAQGAGGQIIDVDFSMQPLRDETGQVIFLIPSAIVITERKRAEDALQSQTSELKALFDVVPAMIWVKDTQNAFLRVNQRAADAIGMRVEEIEGKSASEIFPQQADRYYADDLEVIQSGAPKMGIVEKLRGPGGVELWVQIDKVPYRDQKENVIGLVAMVQDITARHQSEQALRESEERLRFLHDLADAMRPLAEPSQIMALAVRILGAHLCVSRCAYAEAGTMGGCFTILHNYADGCPNLLGDLDLSRFEARAVATLQSGQTLVICNVDAELLPGAAVDRLKAASVQAFICCPLTKEGTLRAMMVVSQTTTRDWQPGEVTLVEEVAERCWAMMERRTAENNLRQSEALLRIASKTARLGGWAVDLPAASVHWSDEVCAIHEMPSGTVPTLAQGIGFYVPQSREMITQAFTDCSEAGTPFDLELEVTTSKGRRVAVRAIGEAQRNSTGIITCIHGAFQDISERKQSEKRIIEQAALIDEARDAILVCDLERRITFWSKGAERLYGWTSEEARGSLLRDLLQVDTIRVVEADRALRESGAWNGEIETTARDGRVLTIDSRWTLMHDADSRPHSILSIDTDITERKQIERQFLRSQRMESIGTLAGGIAHDLNNSLAPILMALDLLAMKFTDPESQGLLEILCTSALRGAAMVRQVLSFGRGVEGERQEVQIRHLVREVEKIVTDTFPKHIQVRTRVPNDLWTIVGDATQLHQVLLNLCVNARDAMPNGGMLTISAENLTVDAHYAGMSINHEARPGPYIFLHVQDTGTGMAAGVIDKIFDPFFTTKEMGKGTGLGLSTTLGIVTSHGGFIRVYSEVGKGTTFNVYLPALPEGADPGAGAQQAAELPRGHDELILLVDDELAVSQITKQTLEAFGYRAILAANGVEAVAIYALRRTEIAAVLTDMMMPEMDGPETIRILRELNPALRVIAISGLAANDHIARATSLGVKHFLLKPCTAETLLRTLSLVLHASN